MLTRVSCPLAAPLSLVRLVAILAILAGLAQPAFAQQTFADWTAQTATDADFTLGAAQGTVTSTNPVNWAGSILSITALDGATNYPESWFSPTPATGMEWLGANANNTTGGTTGSADWVITFGSPVVDPRFHFVNLDNATVDFAATTDTEGNAAVVTRLSGNLELEVTGTVVNSTPASASQAGCEDDGGGNPNGACGSIQLEGAYTSVTLRITDTNTSTGNGDGFQWTISAQLPVPFACTGEAFIVQGNNAQLFQVDQTNDPFTFDPIGPAASHRVNALGFDRGTGLLYAFQRSGNHQLLQIDSAGTIFPLGRPTGVPNDDLNAGDVSPDGSTYYLSRTGSTILSVVPLPALSPVSTVTITGDTGIVADWAVSPTDGLLYGGDAEDGDLAILDPTTGVRTDIAVAGLSAPLSYGGAWFNAAGTLFLYNNTGTILEIDLAGPTIVTTQTGPASTQNDGAACVQDVIGAAKQMSGTDTGLPATITIDYAIENLNGSSTLSDLASQDDLGAVFGVHGTDWTFTSISSSPGAFANPSFDGHTDLELIAPSQSLVPGATATLTVTLQLLTFDAADMDGNFCNQILATGATADGVIFGDLSTDGSDPDPNGDSSPDERSPSCINESTLPVTLMSFSVD